MSRLLNPENWRDVLTSLSAQDVRNLASANKTIQFDEPDRTAQEVQNLGSVNKTLHFDEPESNEPQREEVAKMSMRPAKIPKCSGAREIEIEIDLSASDAGTERDILYMSYWGCKSVWFIASEKFISPLWKRVLHATSARHVFRCTVAASFEHPAFRLLCERVLPPFDREPPLLLNLFESLEKLESLRLSENGITYGELHDLCLAFSRIPSLKHLHLDGNSFKPQDPLNFADPMVEAIQGGFLPSLEELRLNQTRIADAGIIKLSKQLTGLKNLTYLDLENTDLGDEGMTSLNLAIRKMPWLRRLDLSQNHISQEKVRELSRTFWEAEEESLQLTALYLGGNLLNDAVLASFLPLFGTKLSKLTSFSIGSGITNTGMHNLRDAIKSLALIKHLEKPWEKRKVSGEITYHNPNTGVSQYNHPSDPLGTLQELDLGDNDITLEGLKSLWSSIDSGALGNLTVLKLSGNKISDLGMSGLGECMTSFLHRLEKLDLGFNSIDDEGMVGLSRRLQECTSLRHLDLCQNEFSAVGMVKFCDAIVSGALPKLLYLDISSIFGPGSWGIATLSSAIAMGRLKVLEVLDLSSNHIGDVVASYLFLALRSNLAMGASLRILKLGNNQIGDVGMEQLSRAVSGGSFGALKELWLNSNQIRDEGMRAFANAVLPGRDISNSSGVSRSSALNSLEKLVLNSNPISDIGFKALESAIHRGALPNLAEDGAVK